MKLVIENSYSWVKTADPGIKEFLWKTLRFRANGYWHSYLYKRKLWDGYNEFFKKDSGRFLTGLLPEIKTVLKYKNIDFEIQDNRQVFNFAYESVDKNFLDMEMRDYQVDYINSVIKYKRGIITAPTGAGKSMTMRGIIKAIPPKTFTLILGNKKSLVDQNYDEVKSLGIDYVGRLYSGVKEPNYITCATVQSLHLIEALLPKVKVLIVDEIHEMLSKEPKKMYAALKNASVRVGMSATAFKFGGKDQSQKYEAKGWFGPPFLVQSTESGKLTTKELQDRDILSKANCTFYKIKEPNIPYAIYIDAVTYGIAENQKFHEKIKRLVKKLKGRTLVLVERIQHGEALNKMIKGSYWISGDDDIDTRKDVIKKMKSDKGNLIVIGTAGILNTGVDFKIHNLINAASGKADHQIIQRFGRGLRVADDKENLEYYDFIFEINEYLESHSWQRVEILKKEGHVVNISEEEL